MLGCARAKIVSYYSSGHWKHLSRIVKKRDGLQCQICGDRAGDPYCVLHAHHITPRAQGGPDVQENVRLCAIFAMPSSRDGGTSPGLVAPC